MLEPRNRSSTQEISRAASDGGHIADAVLDCYQPRDGVPKGSPRLAQLVNVIMNVSADREQVRDHISCDGIRAPFVEAHVGERRQHDVPPIRQPAEWAYQSRLDVPLGPRRDLPNHRDAIDL